MNLSKIPFGIPFHKMEEKNYTNIPGQSQPTPSIPQTPITPPAASYNAAPPAGAPKKSLFAAKNINLFLLIAVVVFVGAISFNIYVSSTSTNTRASSDLEPAPEVPTGQMALTASVQSYPSAYKGTPIPETLYTQAEEQYANVGSAERKIYIVNRVVLYYVLKNALDENNIDYPGKGSSPSFQDIETNLPEMITQAKMNLISIADFAYMYEWYNGSPSAAEAKAMLGDDLKAEGQKILEEWRVKVEDPKVNAEATVLDSNRDEKVVIMNNKDYNDIVRNYTRDEEFVKKIKNFPFADSGFDGFLFSQQPMKSSALYDMGDGEKFAYIFVYPTRIENRKYDQLADIYADKINDLSF